jgi:5-methylthioadenosine/S-adenosylhomocysteine deaminase
VFDLIVTNATILTMDKSRRVIENGSIGVIGNKISAIWEKDKSHLFQEQGATIIDAKDKIVIPGLVNTHTHFFQILSKGLGDDAPLFDWFRKAVAPSIPFLTAKDCYYAALLGCIESIKSGATCVNDFMYVHPRPKLSDEIIRAMSVIGIRGILSRGIVDSGEDYGIPKSAIQDTNEAVEDCERLIEAYQDFANERIKIWVAPASLWMASTKAFLLAKELSDRYNTWLSWHAAETREVVAETVRRYGKRDVETAQELGLLGENTLAVHCVWLNDQEIELLASNDVKIAHCPVANMYLGDGVAPVPKMLRKDISVGLGTDGAASNNNQDMLALLKTTSLLHKVNNLDPTSMSAQKVMEMASLNGAKALGLEKVIGSIEVKKKADLVILNLSRPNTIPVHDVLSSLVYCSTQENVETVIIDGRIIMKDRRILTVDESAIINEIKLLSRSLIERSRA